MAAPQGQSEVAQLCPTLCDLVDCILPGSSVHGILQARILEWVAISFPMGQSSCFRAPGSGSWTHSQFVHLGHSTLKVLSKHSPKTWRNPHKHKNAVLWVYTEPHVTPKLGKHMPLKCSQAVATPTKDRGMKVLQDTLMQKGKLKICRHLRATLVLSKCC